MAADDSVKRVRSPQFPFVSLDRCVARAKAFEALFHQHAAGIPSAAKAWNYSEKSSGAAQTIGALVAFGLMSDEGSLDRRKLKLTPLAMTILKDARPGAAAQAIKQAALKPKVLAELWSDWQGQRPPDDECVSILHLERGFTEDAARRLLHVYDATIRYAGLAESDLTDYISGEAEPESLVERASSPDKAREADRALTSPKVQLMENERVVFAHEIRPNQGFRIVVTGDVDASLLKAVKAFAEFQGKLLEEGVPQQRALDPAIVSSPQPPSPLPAAPEP